MSSYAPQRPAIRGSVQGLAFPGALVAILTACGGSAPPPEAGDFTGAIPDMMGRTVMVLPVQVVDGVPEPVDPEIEFALNTHGEGIRWVFPDQIRRQVDRTPSLDMDVEDLPVGTFFRAEIQRIGDPLFGYIRRLAALTGAEMAIIPLQVRYRRANATAEAAVEVMSTVLDPVSGRVFWTGVVGGEGGEADDPGTLASAADRFARQMAWSSAERTEP